MLAKYTFAYPIPLRDARDENGNVILNEKGRAVQEVGYEGSTQPVPIRPARPWELNTFWVEVNEGAD